MPEFTDVNGQEKMQVRRTGDLIEFEHEYNLYWFEEDSAVDIAAAVLNVDPQLVQAVVNNRRAVAALISGYIPVHPEDLPPGYERGQKLYYLAPSLEEAEVVEWNKNVFQLAAERGCGAEFWYEGELRVILPESGRRTDSGDLIVTGWDTSRAAVRSFRLDRIQGHAAVRADLKNHT